MDEKCIKVTLFDVHISNDNVVVLYTDIFCIFIVRYDKIDLIQKLIVLYCILIQTTNNKTQ